VVAGELGDELAVLGQRPVALEKTCPEGGDKQRRPAAERRVRHAYAMSSRKRNSCSSAGIAAAKPTLAPSRPWTAQEQSLAASELVVDREPLHAREARLGGVPVHGLLPHHRAGAGRRRIDRPARA
jgi:hypothetical protein